MNDDGNPVPTARLLLDGDKTASVNHDGTFNISFSGGKHFIIFEAPPHPLVTVRFNITKGTTTDIGDVELVTAGIEGGYERNPVNAVIIMAISAGMVIALGTCILLFMARKKAAEKRETGEE